MNFCSIKRESFIISLLIFVILSYLSKISPFEIIYDLDGGGEGSSRKFVCVQKTSVYCETITEFKVFTLQKDNKQM